MIEATKVSSRSVWRYQTAEEADVKESKKAFDAFDSGDLWCAQED